MKNLLLTFFKTTIFWLLIVTTSSATEARRDGNWWLEQPKADKYLYVVGFFDGMELGKNFSFWHWNKKPEFENTVSQVVTSYEIYAQKYLTNVTSGQVTDGLDLFYSDYRNRKIVTSSAVWVILSEIGGAGKEDILKLTENLRKNSN